MNKVSKDSSKVYILEVDLQYPDLHNNYPLLHEKMRSKKVCCQTIAGNV